LVANPAKTKSSDVRVGGFVSSTSAVASLRRALAKPLRADAVIGVDVDYESIQIGHGGGMLMVSASGTAERL